MLAPQFSLRKLLGLVALCGVVCLVVAAAVRGELWSAAVLIALAGLALTAVLQGVLFALVSLMVVVSGWLGRARTRAAASDSDT